jgi:hypothetical protein
MLLRQLQMSLKRMKSRVTQMTQVDAQRLMGAATQATLGTNNTLFPTDMSSLIAGSAVTQCEDFCNLRTPLNSTIMLNMPKLKELGLRMMDVAGIDISCSEQSSALICAIFGKNSGWVEALSDMLRVIKEPAVGDSMEGAISLAAKLDKFNEVYSVVKGPEGGFGTILDRAKARIPMWVVNRARNLLMAFAWLVSKITTKNRAKMVSGGGSAGIPWEQILDDFNHDVRSIAEARLPNRLQEGAVVYDKWCLRARKHAEGDEGVPLEFKPLSTKKVKGCFSFAWNGNCKYGDKCFGVHSVDATCPNGPSCKFFASARGCAFTGADSHDP